MAKKQLSIYIGSNRTRICEVVRNNEKSVSLYNAIEVGTPKGAVEDGCIVDVPAMAEAIKTCIYGRGLTTGKVTFTIASKKIASKEVMLPFTKKEHIPEIIRANAKEYFPMSNLDDYVFAESILEVVQTEEGKMYRVSAIAAPRDIVMSYYELSSELKIPIDTIDYAGNSIFQVLELQMNTDACSMVLQIEKENTFVSILKGKTLVLQRAIPYGKNAIINNLVSMKRISEKDANLLLQDESRLHAAVKEDEYVEAVRFLIGGINRVMEYHLSRNSSLNIDEIKLFGEGCQIAGIADALQKELNVKVSRLLNFQGITLKEGCSIGKADLLRYISCAGAVLQPVNITIPNLSKKRVGGSGAMVSAPSGISAQLLTVVLLAVVFIMIAVIGGFTGVYIWKTGQKHTLEKKVDALAEAETIANTYYAAKKDYDLIRTFEASTESANENLYRFIMDLEDVMPEQVSITNFNIQEGAVALSALGTSKEQVADFIIQLKKLPYITDVFVGAMTQSYGETPEVSFNLNLTMLPPETKEDDAMAELPPAPGETAGENAETEEGGSEE